MNLESILKIEKKMLENSLYRGVEENEISVGYNLNREGLEEYSSSIFSKLNYEDLKKHIQKQ